MKTIQSATIACILAVGIASAATVALAAVHLHSTSILINQVPALAPVIDADLPTVTITAKRLSAQQKAAVAN